MSATTSECALGHRSGALPVRWAFEGPAARTAGERTERLRRRVLYETTACLGPGRGANGDLRLDPSSACLRFSYSAAALLDANVGRAASEAHRALRYNGDASVLALHANPRSTTLLKRGALSESGATIKALTDGATFSVDVSHGAGLYNRVIYDPHARLRTSSVDYPGLAVDPSALLIKGYDASTLVDVCANAIGLDMSLVRVSAAKAAPALRAPEAVHQAALDVRLGAPLGRFAFVRF
jgi:hypothetical protein